MEDWGEKNLSAVMEYPMDFERYIERRLKEIDDLDERRQAKEILWNSLGKILHCMEEKYQALKQRIYRETEVPAGCYETVSTIIRREDYDPTNDTLFPVCPEDLQYEIKGREITENGIYIFGERTLEQFNGDPIEYFNKKYKTAIGNCHEGDGELFRGAGYIHLTGRGNYTNFSKYIGDPEILVEGYRVVGGVYNRDISQIASKDVGVIDIGKYAWEASGWFWKIGNPDGNDLSTYADKLMWEDTSKAINRKGDSLYERNRNMNKFYKILTNKELGLPEEEHE